MYALVCLHV